jgi:hypothetical protein
VQCQTMVVASPSALCDSTHELACGSPSMIQDRSIGRGVSSTSVLPNSISARDIAKPSSAKWEGKLAATF